MPSYAGIGSRIITTDIRNQIISLGEFLAESGYALRSGGSGGADLAFEKGCDNLDGEKEIYLPWKGFNKHTSQLYPPSPACYKIGKKYHPNWDKLKKSVTHLIARNAHQILGQDLTDPVEFIVCWTLDGCEDGTKTTRGTGGTGHALRIATDLNIPIFNIKNQLSYETLLDRFVV